MEEITTFLNDYKNELLQSPTSDEIVHPKIVGNYNLDKEDVHNQIIDWVLYYLENKKCPYQLAISIAKITANHVCADMLKQYEENTNSEQRKMLNSVSLYTDTVRRLPSVCMSFLEGSNENEVCSSSCSLSYTVSVFAIKNKRRKMEDRHVIHHNLNWLLDMKNAPTHSYYAVFDGHSGVDAASYASAHLHVNIAKHPAFLTDTATAIAEAYKATDENFLKRCSEENIKSGCTVISALIREKTVYLSWLGDSQAVLVKEGKPVIVTNPHKPDREDERKRIEDLGGEITTYTGISRVNGILAVTRALGDPDHKRFICSEPEITTVDLDGTEDFLILACDGLWDGMSPEDVTSALYYNLSGSALDEPLDVVAAKLVHQSKLQGSEDNITAIVIFLRDIKIIRDYASQLLPQACSQMNFHEMNGEGKSCPVDGVSNSPRAKPTLWELDAAKELKNAANVLSSAAFPGTSYSEGFNDNISFQTVYDNAAFLPQQRVASCLAPEATALSELPTPPIDDVLAAQQFEKLSSMDFCQEPGPFNPATDLIDSSIPPLCESNTVEHSFGADLLGSADSQVPFPAHTSDDLSTLPHELNLSAFAATDITPDEAVDIANCVVSNTIETAIKHISSSELSESVPIVPTQKLNPYAEPFVMKSFIQSDEFQITPTSPTALPEAAEPPVNTLNNVVVAFDDNAVGCEFSTSPLKATDPFNANQSEDLFSALVSEMPPPAPVLSEKQGITENVIGNLLDSTNTEQSSELNSATSEIVSPETDLLPKENIADLHQDPLLETCNEKDLSEKLSELSLQSSDVQPKAELTIEELIISKVESNAGQIYSETTHVSSYSDQETSLTFGDYVTKTVTSEIDMNTDSFKDTEENNSQAIETNFSTGQIIEDVLMADSHPLEGLSLAPTSTETAQLETSDVSCKLKDDSHPMEELSLTPTSPDKDLDVYPNMPAKPSNDATECTSSQPETSDVSSDSAPQEQISTTPEGDAGTIVILQNETHNSLIIGTLAEPIGVTALPPDPADEAPVETFAVDLQTIPAEVPEAEGVTEDVDSDSEKDGGWSYVKPNTEVKTDNDTKPKSEVLSPKTEKLPTKADANTKLRKEVLKTAADNKSKVKAASPIDKTKKTLMDKKALEIKDRIKPIKSTASSFSKTTLEKTVKAPTTMSRIKPKEAPAAASTTSKPSTVKLPRAAPVRNTATLGKSSTLQTTERSQVTMKSGVSNQPAGGNIRPKSALSTSTATRVNLRQANASTSLTKDLPSHQSTKSNTSQVTRTTTVSRTVPNRDLTKPLLAKASTVESKTKTLSPTVRKTTLSVPLKKPVVKETKEIVNKQISARRNAPVVATNKSEPAKSATRPPTMLSNKAVPIKPRSALVKNDASKKELPKPPVSKFPAKKNTISKVSQIAAKGKEIKPTLIQKSVEKKIDVAAEGDGIVPASTPASEQEKFILEANDKEVKLKEKDEAGLNPDQQPQNLENGDLEASVKPLDEIAPPTSSVSESIL